MSSVAITTSKLLINFPTSGRHFALTHLTGMTILDQAYLDAEAIGTKFAELIKFYQYQMNNTSIKFTNDVLRRYITLLTNSANYSSLVQAYISLEAPNIPISVNNEKVKKDLLEVTQALIDTADDLAWIIVLLKNEMELIKTTFEEIQQQYDDTLSEFIKSSGSNVEELNKKIAEKNKEINEDIEAIVEGGKDLSKGLDDLANGTLTSIAKVPSEKKEKEEKSRVKIRLKGDEPEPNYAIEAIHLSAAGIAKGTKATKALAIHNKELAALYQEMSKAKAICSVAVSTQIQNRLFIDNFEKGVSDGVLLDTNWQEVAASCTQLKTDIANLSNETEALALKKNVELSVREWTELDNQLQKLKQAFTGS